MAKLDFERCKIGARFDKKNDLSMKNSVLHNDTSKWAIFGLKHGSKTRQ